MKLRRLLGFTVVELIVVVVIIVGLATITNFAIGSWRTRTAKTEVTHALSSAATALKNHKIFNNGYPTGSPPVMPSSYDPAQGVTITYISGTASTYCLRANSLLVPAVVMYVTQATSTPTATACT